MRVAVQSRKVNLLAVDSSGLSSAYKVPVDSKLQDFTLSVSGAQANVTIYDPHGEYS